MAASNGARKARFEAVHADASEQIAHDRAPRERIDRGDARVRERHPVRAARGADVLEVPLAGLAAERSDETTIGALAEAIADAVGRDPAGEEFRLADTRFHQTIAITAGNDLMGTVLRSVDAG